MAEKGPVGKMILPAVSKHPCVVCQKRKVKCDRKDPCTRCLTAGEVCKQPEAQRPPRRPRRTEDTNLLSRVRQLEEALQQMTKSAATSTLAQDLRTGKAVGVHRNGEDSEVLEDSVGRLIIDDDRTRYISGSSWANLADEVVDLRSLLEEDDEGSFDDPLSFKRTFTDNISDGMFPSFNTQMKGFQSQSGLAFLWQVYLRNIDPTMKVFHAPSMHSMIDSVLSGSTHISKENSCLAAAIKFAAVTSLTDEQCWAALNTSRTSLLDLYRAEVQAALNATNFLSTHDLTTLQAYVVYQFCNRRHEHPRAMWIASGIAIRLAQSIGLHRDGAGMKLPVLATEVRRRLFWELRMFDLGCAEDCGFLPTYIYGADTKLPLNINDEDIDSETTVPPSERQGFTDMTYPLIRYEMCNRLHGLYHRDGKPSIGPMQGDRERIPEQAQALIECRTMIESKYLRHCSPSIPFQKTVLWVGRVILEKQKLLAQYPLFHNCSRSKQISSDVKNDLCETSCDILELSNEIVQDPETTSWTWMLQTYVHWHPVAFLLNELCAAPLHPQAARAWSAVNSEITTPHGLSPEANLALWRPLRGLYEKARLSQRAASANTFLDGPGMAMPSGVPKDTSEQPNVPTSMPGISLTSSGYSPVTADLQTPFATMTDFMTNSSPFQDDIDSWWVSNDFTPNATSL